MAGWLDLNCKNTAAIKQLPRRSALISREAELSGRDAEIVRLREQLQGLEELSVSMSRDLTETRARLADQGTQEQHLQETTDKLKEMKILHDNQEVEHKKQIQNYVKQLGNKERETDELKTEIEEAETENQQLRERVEQVRSNWESTVKEIELELENTRLNFTKRVAGLEEEVAVEQQERVRLGRVRQQQEQRICQLENSDEKDEIIAKLKLDFKKRGILLRDAQNTVAKLKTENSKKTMVGQLRQQVEDLEAEILTAARTKKQLEQQLEESQAVVEDGERARSRLEQRLQAALQEVEIFAHLLCWRGDQTNLLSR